MPDKSTFAKILFAAYIITLGVLCFIRLDGMPEVSADIFGIPTDKVVHFIMFFPFPLLALASFGKITRKPWHSFAFTLVVFATGCIIAIGTEIGQGLTSYRSADPADFMADGIALAISSILVLIIDLRKQFA